MKVLLDTHAFIWWDCETSRRLFPPVGGLVALGALRVPCYARTRNFLGSPAGPATWTEQARHGSKEWMTLNSSMGWVAWRS